MKVTLVMLCALAASIAGFSQEKSFDLNNYKFPDYKRHELELQLNSWGYANKESNNFYDASGALDKKDYKSAYNNSHLTLGYQYNKLTRKQIDFLYSALSGDYLYSMSEDFNIKDVRIDPSLHWSVNGFKKYYIIENKFFVKGQTDLDISWSNSKRTLTSTPDNIHHLNNQSLSVGLGLGLGRIEKVSDLWQAYYLLEKLNKQGSFNRELTEEDVYEFARLSSRLKNKRFFDARLQKIEELQGLDSLLHQQGLIQESDISYFTTLNDYWSYGNFQDRESGIELILSSAPVYERAYRKTNNDEAKISEITSIVSTVGFTCIKQLNLFWERSFGADISYESIIDSTGNHFFEAPDDQYSTHAHLAYGYFPNSRTALQGFLSYQGDQISVFKAQNISADAWRNMVSFHMSGNYFFSPRVQMTANVSISYTDKNYNTSDKINTYYNLGLRYAIF